MRATADLIAAAGPDRLTGVRVIGVDEHRWAPRRVDPAGFVTLIIDLTPTHDQTGLVRSARPGPWTISDRTGRLAGRPTRLLRPGRGSHCDGRVAGDKTAATEASAYRRWGTSVVVRDGAVVR